VTQVSSSTREEISSSDAVPSVENNSNNPNSPDPRLTDALKQWGDSESQAPSEMTRQRHLKKLQQTPSARRVPTWLAVAAAVALVATAGVVIGTSSSDTSNNIASSVEEDRDLKPVDFVTPVPFERSEEYVMLSVDASRATAIATELETTLGTAPAVIGVSKTATTFVVPASAALTLTDTSGITAVADTPVKAIAEQTPVPSWGLDRIDATTDLLNNSYKYVSTGSGSIIYVIDTGVYASHSDLSGRVVAGYTAVADGNGTEDCNGHGTHVAGTAAGTKYGVAKTARVVAVRVLDCAGSGYTSSVVAGINWAVASHPGGPGVINLSLGGGANSALDDAVAKATAAGLVVVAAAGNSGADACNFSPARATSALTIGATEKTDAPASYSNFGACVDMYAPGSGITSAWIAGSTATRTISGTSMAAPHVAGLAARLQQAQPGISVSGISSTLTATKTGTGSVTIANFVEDEPTAPIDETTTTALATTTTLLNSTTTSVVVTTTSIPSTTVAPTTTTTAPRPGKSEKSPGNTKAPGKNKTVSQPKEFSLGYETRDNVSALFASWVDDATSDTYEVACAPLRLGANAVPSTKFMVERSAVAQTAGGRSETLLLLSPSESQRCWVTAMIGTDKSAQSNPAVLNVQAQRKDVPTVPTTTTPPPPTTSTTVVTTTTLATERATPGNSPKAPPAPTTPPNPGQGQGSGKNPKK
jgi:subtilisin family serine protease